MLNPPRLVAVDTNVALDFAKGIEDVRDAIATIRTRLAGVELLLPPTVVQELAHAAVKSGYADVRAAAVKILRRREGVDFKLLNYVPLGHEHVERIAQRLRHCGLIPTGEVHDSIILVEASALGCSLVTTSDDDLRGLDPERLAFEFAAFDLAAPVIATPREIVRKFFR